MVPHRLLRQGGVAERIERRSLLRRQFGQGHPQMIGNRAFGVEDTAKREFMERIGISKRLRHWCERREARGERGHLAQRSLRQHQLLRQGFQPVGLLLAVRFLEAAVAVVT